MKVGLLAVFLLWSQVTAFAATHTVFVVDKVVQGGKGTFYGVKTKALDGDYHSSPAVITDFIERCPAVSFTQSRPKADYILDTEPGSSTITDQQGTVLYTSSAKNLKNMAKDVCAFVSTH
ncbi:hypothetical protein RBB79_06855 [Tunturiibacter empetritectus]|uniref:Uncharacterized protein n=1 Tax=Tunturiibacter lichenicola TaxID=2051959 RepID=A0A852VIB7_9BACT|nr:hypothetical protein [Edaphobacter lichenicola]NYF89252.1 hypothetical protein [Edaphobacter lichenicola]